MRRACTLSLAALCSLTLLVGLPGSALAASSFELVRNDYLKHFAVTPCKFTAKQLQEAKTTIPNDYAQYAPDFQDAIDAAAKQRAAGACGKKTGTDKQQTPVAPAAPTTTPGTPPPAAPAKTKGAKTTSTPATVTTGSAAAPTPQPTPSVTPAPPVADGKILAAARSTDSGSDLPAPLVALAILALLAALAGAVVMSTRWLAVEPHWVVRSRHATAEAGWRTSAAWAEFRDWLRLGR